MKKKISMWIAVIMTLEIMLPSVLGLGTSVSVQAAAGDRPVIMIADLGTAPSIIAETGYTPGQNTVGAEFKSAVLQLMFNQEVALGSVGKVHIYNAADGVLAETLSIDNGKSTTVFVDGTDPKRMNFKTSKLVPSIQYYVLMTEGTVVSKDAVPVAFAGITDPQQWVFTTKGLPVPGVITQRIPERDAVNVALNSPIQLIFDKKITKGNGNMNITIQPEGSSVTNIPVNTSRVTGFGTNTISIIPGFALQNNKRYTVTVPASAFVDEENNPAPQSIENWSFTAIGDMSALRETSVSPANNSTVSLSTDLALTFNRAVKAANGSDYAIIRLYNETSGQSMDVNVVVDVKNPTQIRSVNKVTLDQNSSYYVVVDNGVFVDRVNTGIVYGGLNGSYNWNFKTSSNDKVAPVLQTSLMHNATTIRLTYNETLNYSNYMYSSNFAVTVNGETRKISQVYTSGESVYVVLEIGVSVGQNVKISYTGGNSGIMDVALNPAASFGLREVTNGIDSALPKPREGTAYGTTLTLSFNETLKKPSTNAYQQFTVTADGSSLGVRSMSQSGSSLVLTLNKRISDGDVIQVSYSPGSYPIQDYRGMNMSAFSDFFVRNQIDNKPPIFMGAEGSGSKVILKYNEALRTDNLPMKSQFSILVNKVPNYVTGVAVNVNHVELTLATAITTSQEVTVSYVPGVGSQRITDLNGNSAGYINLEPMGLSTSSLNADVKSASIKGDTLTLQFHNSLTSSLDTYALSALFIVRVDNTVRSVQATNVSGNTVTLRLMSPVSVGQQVQVSFNSMSNALRDSQGNSIQSFSNLNVQNSGTTVDGKPGSLGTLSESEFGRLMYVLNTSAATVSSGMSKYNQSVQKYKIDPVKLKEAYDDVATTSTASRTIVFEVPAMEKAAYVGVPLQTLQEAYYKDPKAQFAVRMGDSVYSIPLGSFNASEITRELTAVTSTIMIWIQIEKVPTYAVSVMLNQMSQLGANVIVEPYDFYVSAENTTSTRSIPLNVTSEYLIRTAKPASENTTALMYFDKSTAEPSFVPSKVERWSGGIILHAKVRANYMVTGVTGNKFYADVTNHWAKSEINELLAKFVVNGRTSVAFEPNSNITRGEFAVFIAKALGLSGDSQAASRFSDVQSFTATGAYIGAATKAGIITGNTDGTFKADKYVTREQMAIMMVRAMDYAEYKSANTSTAVTTLSKFKDRGKIQSLDSVSRAVKEGIIQGVSTTTFQPQGNATRAQAAVMVKRLLSTIGYL
ncbi:SwmB domain-containing protein [Paenibacillus sp. FA6]|uniref:SwmB domain-containing protein n=1 Tax=Paenibacillus sp. FA6 TaxID=3413029 RepID=UPI003F65B656